MTEIPNPQVVIPTEADIAERHVALPTNLAPAEGDRTALARDDLRHVLGIDQDGGPLDFAWFRETTRDLGNDLVLGVIRFADQARNGRGTVVSQVDVHELVRALTFGEEVLTQAGQAFMRAAAECRDQVGQELVAAVGEQDGVPSGTLTVPDGGGHRIKVQAVTTKKPDTWDLVSIAGVVAEVATQRHQTTWPTAENPPDLARVAVDLLLSVLASPKPLIRQLNALRDELSVAGNIDAASALDQARVKGAEVWTGETKVTREVSK